MLNTLPADILENYDNLSYEEKQEINNLYVWGPMMTDYITNSCVTLYSDTSAFYAHRIRSITVTSADSAWWYESGNHHLDLYCKICDAQGHVLHTTGMKMNSKLPATFDFSIPFYIIFN